ncbi:response regulator transcription factor [Dyadobacter sp. OTU695]|uniref:response regulator transcription factor n=1 Tax=Dyadobacter sp. OTU695 TaxID=3043860 RepID=UPI00313E95D9
MRILIAEDHRALLDSLARLISGFEGVEVITKHTNGHQVLTALEADPDIDLVVSDLKMPVMGGIELTLQIKERFPGVKICLLTGADEPDLIKEAMRAGADGYVLKDTELGELETAMNLIVAGNKFYSPEVLNLLANDQEIEFVPETDDFLKIAITQTEMDVLKLIAQEFSGTQIAEKLFISANAVETHRKHLMQKLGVQSTIGLVKYAVKNNLIK